MNKYKLRQIIIQVISTEKWDNLTRANTLTEILKSFGQIVLDFFIALLIPFYLLLVQMLVLGWTVCACIWQIIKALRSEEI